MFFEGSIQIEESYYILIWSLVTCHERYQCSVNKKIEGVINIM